MNAACSCAPMRALKAQPQSHARVRRISIAYTDAHFMNAKFVSIYAFANVAPICAACAYK
eukprot:2165761-Pleurochrysis_carterae.AAC.2